MRDFNHKRVGDKIADVVRQVNERKQLAQANGIIPMPPTFAELQRNADAVANQSQCVSASPTHAIHPSVENGAIAVDGES